MTPNTIHQLIGRALTDPSFREQLLQRPQVAVKEYSLSDVEQSHITSLQAVDLEEFSRLLSERLRDPAEPISKKNGGSQRHF
jgi:hypothetical protein